MGRLVAVGQLYPLSGALNWHTDIFLQWGLSVSLGGAAEFLYCEPLAPPDQVQSIWVESGDVLLANFGELVHCVSRTLPSTAPAWWHAVNNYGRARCNLQLRDASTYRGPLMARDAHRKFVHSTST